MRGGGLPSILLYEWSVRSIPESIGPANFRKDRTDQSVSLEVPVEAHVVVPEKKRSPRLVLKSIGSINFFWDCTMGGGGHRFF